MSSAAAPKKRPSWVVVIPSRLVIQPPSLPYMPPARRAALHYVTIVSLFTVLGSGLALYTVKQHTTQAERDIVQTRRATEEMRRQTGMLQAEWAALNNPDRLRALAARHLALRRIDPSQYAQINTLPHRIEHPPAPPALPEDPQPTAAVPPATVEAPAAPVRIAAAPVIHSPPAPAASPAPPKKPPPAPPVRQMATVAPPAHIYHHAGIAMSDPPHDLALPPAMQSPAVSARYQTTLAEPAPQAPTPPVVAARPSYPAYYYPGYYQPAAPQSSPHLPPPVPYQGGDD